MHPQGAPGAARTRRVVVAVLTHRRTAMLGDLLPVLQREAEMGRRGGGRVDRVRVLVVDNDSGASARALVAAAGLPDVSYVHEPRPGISAARNRALDEADDEDVLVFIDDDEVPEPGWLAALLRTHAATGAAMVAGPVVSRFLGEPDPFVVAGGFFERSHHAGRRTGSPLRRAATNNLLLDLHAVRRHGVRFDDAFGRSGGEDTLFTGSLVRVGEPAVWCAEAPVIDLVPPERLTSAYVLRRTEMLAQSSLLAELALCRSSRERTSLRVQAASQESARAMVALAQAARGAIRRHAGDAARARRSMARVRGVARALAGRRPVVYGNP